jgi:hypothetical protein
VLALWSEGGVVLKIVLLVVFWGAVFIIFLGWKYGAKPFKAERLRGPLDEEKKI